MPDRPSAQIKTPFNATMKSQNLGARQPSQFMWTGDTGRMLWLCEMFCDLWFCCRYSSFTLLSCSFGFSKVSDITALVFLKLSNSDWLLSLALRMLIPDNGKAKKKYPCRWQPDVDLVLRNISWICPCLSSPGCRIKSRIFSSSSVSGINTGHQLLCCVSQPTHSKTPKNSLQPTAANSLAESCICIR